MKKKRLLLRLLASPFILGMLIIVYIYYSIRRWLDFMKYGGEFINYEKEDQKTIQQIYEQLKNSN